MIRVINGLQIFIENPKGSMRYGRDWTQCMANDYGYIEGTVGHDGDEVDCFLGGIMSSPVFHVIDQKNPHTGRFDEHKVMFGFGNMVAAQNAYHDNYQQGWQGFAHVRELPVTSFWSWYRSTLNN